jgi:hypothetical protein
MRRTLVSPFGCVRPASSGPSSDGPQRRCRRCRSRDFVNMAESTIVGGSNLVLGVWLHGTTGRRRWARGARWATTWASVRGVRGEVCYTLLGTNPSPRASRPPPPGKRWCHSPAVAGGQGATRASTRPCVRSSASTRPLAATATAAAAAATAFATATATAARARGDRYEREAAAGTTETTGDGYADRGASARRRSSVGRRFWAVRRVHRTNYEDAGGRVYGDDGFDALPRCGANRNEGGTGPRGPRLRTKTVGSDLAQTWLAGLRRSDAASKCQNCPPIIFRTCDYADFH